LEKIEDVLTLTAATREIPKEAFKNESVALVSKSGSSPSKALLGKEPSVPSEPVGVSRVTGN